MLVKIFTGCPIILFVFVCHMSDVVVKKGHYEEKVIPVSKRLQTALIARFHDELTSARQGCLHYKQKVGAFLYRYLYAVVPCKASHSTCGL